MSHNRHTSSRRKINKNRNRRRKSSQQNPSYEALEDRRLLAFDTGIDITSITFGRNGSDPPNVAGGIGPNHVVEVVNSQFRVYDKADGTLLVDKTLDLFWTDAGGPGDPGDPGAESSVEMVAGAANARVIYDVDTRRWFISATSTADVITGADGVQSPVLVAVSRTSNPTQDWQSLTNTYDEDADPETPRVRYQGGFLSAGAGAISTSLAVDKDNLYVTVGEASPFVPPQTWVFNKRSDLVVPTPTSENPSAAFVASADLQWSVDVTGTNVGAFGLYAPTNGNQIGLTELTDADIPGGATFEADVMITVDPYQAPPPFVRQEFDPDLVNSSSQFSAHTVRHGNSLWAVHAIMGSSGDTSAVRWYEIDLDTNTVSQSGTIEHATENYIFPSIAVTEKGHIAIGYTSAGIGLFPSATVSIGYDNNGTMTIEDPVHLKDGEGGYFDGVGNFWGRYTSTIADPNDPDKVWVYGQWSDDSDDGQTQIVELTLTGLSPLILGTAGDNEFVVRRSAFDNAQIEVLVDGVVVEVVRESVLYSFTIDGNGGDDTFVIDTSNGEMDFVGGVNFIGDGDDQIEMRTVEHTNWEMGLNGSGLASVGNDFPGSCEENIEDLLTFQLNFEEGSGWFDTTPWNQDGYATYGDALRGELQSYFDTVIAPIFAGTFTIELDINDDETDTFASAAALGWGYEDVGGQNLWVSSPWSILTGRGDRNGDESEGIIEYNLGLDLYGGDAQALLDNISGGLTRNQFFRVLGMESFIPNETQTFDPRGSRNVASVMDVQYRDLNDAPVVGNYSSTDSMFDVLNYVTNSNWAGDNTGIYFLGVDDVGNEMRLAVNSNTELIDFDTIASSLGGTSRDGDWNDIIEQDRAFLRGLGYDLRPVNPIVPGEGLPVFFVGLDQVQAGDGVDSFCIRSSNVDMEIRSGIGNDVFNVTGLGVGALDLFGEDGDDLYTVVFSPAGVITISDSIGSENDTLVGLGTADEDRFVFDVGGVKVNAGLLVYVGIENISFDGRDSDDIFEVKAAYAGITQLIGGDGSDTFIVNDEGAGSNGNVLTVSVVDPLTDPTDQLKLDIASVITDTYYADQIENLMVDGLFIIDGVNGTPTVAGGLNLLGDGDDRLQLESSLDAVWLIDGDGSGNVVMDVDPMTFTNLERIEGSHGVDELTVQITGTDLRFDSRESDDVITINNAGAGVMTVNGGQGADSMTVTNSGGGVNLNGMLGNDLFTMNDLGAGLANLSGGDGDDTFQILNSGVAGLVANGDAGADTFDVDNPAGTADVALMGGGDNDLFNVINSGLGTLELRGELGDDTYRVTYVDPTIAFSIIDSVNAENDTLFAVATDGDDVFDIFGDGASLNGGVQWMVVGVENLNYDGLLGNDQFNINMGNSWSDSLVVTGDDGNDTFTVNNGGAGPISLMGEAGDDTYIVHFTPTTDVTVSDSANAESDSFFGFGTPSADVLAIAGSVADVNGGTAVWAGVESVEFDALGGNDVYAIDGAFGNSRFNGGDNNDIFNIASTTSGNVFLGNAGNDEFNLLSTTGGADFLGGTGNDLFNIGTATGVSSFFGESGLDRFVVTSHLPLGSPGLIDIDGGEDRNEIVVNGYQTMSNMVTVTNNRITGMSGVPIEFAAAGSFSIANGVGGIQLIGSDNDNDAFEVQSILRENSLEMLGGGGDDRFTVRAATLGTVRSDGQEGSDVYQYAVGSDNNRFLFAVDSGIVGWDLLVVTLTDNDDQLNLSGESFVVGTDNFEFNENFESLVVNTREGNDTVDINRVRVDFLRVMTQGGADQINIHNFTGISSILLEAGGGNDSIVANVGTVSGILTAYGGTGDDEFYISEGSYGNAIIDGQQGSDSYEIFFADRSNRWIVARDSGLTGTDELTVHGSTLDDYLTMRSGVIATPHQSVLYNDKTEVTNLMTEGSNDVVSIFGFGSPVTNVMGQGGRDLVFVNSTFGPTGGRVLNIDLGTGNDTAAISGTGVDVVTNVYGGVGDDAINLGSSFAANNGNLDNLRGVVNFDGGTGYDRAYLNDVGKVASFDYNVGPTSVLNGGTGSSFFGGFYYDGTTERLRLDATNYRNHVNVTASTDTAFSLFGSGGYNTVTLLGDALEDGREFFDLGGGSGYWTFTNGQKDVFFKDFDLV